jgi:hypothetical protein
MSVKQSVEWELAGETEALGESSTLSTTHPTWLDLESNPDRRGGKPATNRLSYGAAYIRISIFQIDHNNFLQKSFRVHLSSFSLTP